ncbi:MAG TPA: phosphoribosylglycinamide formyltransferase [Polyangiaceae bacterium]
MNIAIFASHFGSTLQAILDAAKSGELRATPRLVISNNSASEALNRAKRAGVATRHLSSLTHANQGELDAEIVRTLSEHAIDVVVLAGYMKKLGPQVIRAYAGRILNTHPALLPKFGGQGMYGDRVHAAVLVANEAESGATVHWVDEEYDRGGVIAQVRVPVLASDDVAALGKRVQAAEKQLLVRTLNQLAQGEIELPRR